MAGVLTSKFDVLRGWPEGPAVDDFFTPKSGETLVEGSVCVVHTDGTLKKAVQADVIGDFVQGSTDRRTFWLVVEGTGTDSATSSGKVMAITGNFIARTANIKTGDTYAADDRITVDADAASSGKVTARTGSNECILGEVLEKEGSGADTVLTISFSL